MRPAVQRVTYAVRPQRKILAPLAVGLLAVNVVVAQQEVTPGSSLSPRISVSEAESRIQKHIATIEQRQKPMDRLYLKPEDATNALQAPCAKALAQGKKPEYPPDDCDVMQKEHLLRWTWGGVVSDYYSGHVQALSRSLDVINSQGFAVASDMGYIDTGMEAWSEHEPEVAKGMSEYAYFLAKQDIGTLLDQNTGTPLCPATDCPVLNGINYSWFSAINPAASTNERIDSARPTKSSSNAGPTPALTSMPALGTGERTDQTSPENTPQNIDPATALAAAAGALIIAAMTQPGAIAEDDDEVIPLVPGDDDGGGNGGAPLTTSPEGICAMPWSSGGGKQTGFPDPFDANGGGDPTTDGEEGPDDKPDDSDDEDEPDEGVDGKTDQAAGENEAKAGSGPFPPSDGERAKKNYGPGGILNQPLGVTNQPRDIPGYHDNVVDITMDDLGHIYITRRDEDHVFDPSVSPHDPSAQFDYIDPGETNELGKVLSPDELEAYNQMVAERGAMPIVRDENGSFNLAPDVMTHEQWKQYEQLIDEGPNGAPNLPRQPNGEPKTVDQTQGTDIPRTQERPGTGDPNAVQGSNAEDPNAQPPTYSEERERAVQQGMVDKANAEGETTPPAPAAPATDYTKGLVPPPADYPDELKEIWEKVKAGDSDARQQWQNLMGTPESQGHFQAALAQAKIDVQQAAEQASFDKKVAGGLDAVLPGAGTLFTEIGGSGTVKELMTSTDWKKEWNDTALAIGDQVQKRVDSLAESIVAIPDKVNEAVDTLKQATSGWDLDQLKGTLAYTSDQASEALSNAEKAVTETVDKVTDKLADAINDPTGTAKNVLDSAEDAAKNLQDAVNKAEKDFWRADPDKVRTVLADATVEVASQAGQAALMEGGLSALGKGYEAIRGSEALEEGMGALKGGEEVDNLGRAGGDLEAAGGGSAHTSELSQLETLTADTPAPVEHGRPESVGEMKGASAPETVGPSESSTPSASEHPEAGTGPKAEAPVESAQPGEAHGAASGQLPASETVGVTSEQQIVHDSKLPPSGDTMTSASEGGPRPETTTSGSDASGPGRSDGPGGVSGGEPPAPGQPPSGETQTVSSTQLDAQSVGTGNEKSIVHDTKLAASGDTATSSYTAESETQTAAGDAGSSIGRAPVDPHGAGGVPEYAMAGDVPPEASGEQMYQPPKGDASGTGEPMPSEPVDHSGATLSTDTPATQKTIGPGEGPQPESSAPEREAKYRPAEKTWGRDKAPQPEATAPEREAKYPPAEKAPGAGEAPRPQSSAPESEAEHSSVEKTIQTEAVSQPGSKPIRPGERIPGQPPVRPLPSGALVGPGMRPSGGVRYGFDYQNEIYEHYGQVTVSTTEVTSTNPDRVRDALQGLAESEAGGLRRGEGIELHETPLYGDPTQTDVQALTKDEHRLGEEGMWRHHRASPEGRPEGGTAEVTRRNRRRE